MSENFVNLDIETYQSLQQEILELRDRVVYLERARLTEPYALARQKTLLGTIGTIRASLNLEQIFQQTAREIRQLLDADRVGVFRFEPDSEYMEGKFLSEDVREGYNSALVEKVRDRCFGEKYVTYYQNGRVQAIADIYNAGLSNCHLQILSHFQIKANLVVPLVLKNKLWGLLCIHQCSDTRIWQAEEIDFIQQIAIHLDVAIYQANLLKQTQEQAEELQQINQQLEQKVRERTVQLISSNQELQSEIRYRKQAEEELQKLNAELENRVRERTLKLQASEARFQNLAANVPGVICQLRIDSDGCRSFPYVSPSSRSLLELEPEEIGKIFDIVYSEEREELEQKIINSARNLEIFEWEGRIITASKKVKWMRISSRPKGQPDGAIVWDALLTDITDRKQSEIKLAQKTQDLENTLRTLQQTQTQLVQSEKMSSLGQLVAGVAHEINNPVNFIFGNLSHANDYAKTLLDIIEKYQEFYPDPVWEVQAEIEAAELDFLIEDFPKLICSMQVGAERIREIIAALRNFSRLDESESKIVDIHDGIDSTLMILHNRIKPKSDSAGIQIIKNYGDLPPVECYPGQLNQVFMNILVNSIDALEERDKDRNRQDIKKNPSAIVVTTKVIESEAKVRIKISDNGPGIPEKVQHRIFDPFFTTKGLGKGTGLGMSISYQIITEKHHGTIECVSAEGKGAEFIINLPICIRTS